MIVIIEGPDGGGKTTLARQLAVRYNLEYRHEGPPPKGTKNTLVYYGEILDSYRGKDVVFDRFALGERVYGPVLRGMDTLGDMGWKVMSRLYSAVGATQIMCLPPYSVCRDNWASGRPELFKDEQRFRDTYMLFEDLSRTSNQLVVDYTKPRKFNLPSFQVRTLLPGYIGSPNARYLFVGDRGSNSFAKIDLPFFASVGSSAYLNEAIAAAGFYEDEIAFVNAWKQPRIVDKVLHYEQREIIPYPTVIALGSLAADACTHQEIKNVHVLPHPQYWKRFKHHDVEGYVTLLRGCRIP